MEEPDSTIENILLEIRPSDILRRSNNSKQELHRRSTNLLQNQSEEQRGAEPTAKPYLQLDFSSQGSEERDAEDSVDSKASSAREALLENEIKLLHQTIDSLKEKGRLYEEELEQLNSERTSLLEYNAQVREEYNKIETKLEIYTDKIKALEQSNLLLEAQLHTPPQDPPYHQLKEQLLAKEEENLLLFNKLKHCLNFSEETQLNFEIKLSALQQQLNAQGKKGKLSRQELRLEEVPGSAGTERRKCPQSLLSAKSSSHKGLGTVSSVKSNGRRKLTTGYKQGRPKTPHPITENKENKLRGEDIRRSYSKERIASHLGCRKSMLTNSGI